MHSAKIKGTAEKSQTYLLEGVILHFMKRTKTNILVFGVCRGFSKIIRNITPKHLKIGVINCDTLNNWMTKRQYLSDIFRINIIRFCVKSKKQFVPCTDGFP